MLALSVLGNYTPLLTNFGYAYPFYLKPGYKLLVFNPKTYDVCPAEIIDIHFSVETPTCCFLSSTFWWFVPFSKFYRLIYINPDIFSVEYNPDVALRFFASQKERRNNYQVYYETKNAQYYAIKNAMWPACILKPDEKQKEILRSALRPNSGIVSSDFPSILDLCITANNLAHEQENPKYVAYVFFFSRKYVLRYKAFYPDEVYCSKDGNAKFYLGIQRIKKLDIESPNILKSIIILDGVDKNVLPIVANHVFLPSS